MKFILYNNSFRNILLIPALLISLGVMGQNSFENTEEKSIVTTVKNADLKWGECPPFMPDGCGIAVLHGDPAKQNVDILFKVQGNSYIPNHWHNSPERMILLEGELQVTYENETSQIMKVGSYAYGPSKKPHTAKCLSKDPCVIFIAFEQPLDAFAIETDKK
ncbi:MAG: cupin domain-containing protein [Flavobacteriaceae bacterium]|nr:cupin domain-containing protein [Flavobacteriaceae bacterium]